MSKIDAQVGDISIEYDLDVVKVIIPVDTLVWAFERKEDIGSPKITNQALFIEELCEEIINGEPPNNDRDGRTRLENLLDDSFDSVYENGSESIDYESSEN